MGRTREHHAHDRRDRHHGRRSTSTARASTDGRDRRAVLRPHARRVRAPRAVRPRPSRRRATSRSTRTTPSRTSASCSGQAIAEALGDKAGITRFGSAAVPMDEALVLAAVDISGRGQLHYDVELPIEIIGTFDTTLAKEFLIALATNAGVTLHVRSLAGENSHHIIEAAFKAVARALARRRSRIDPRVGGVPSHEGQRCEPRSHRRLPDGQPAQRAEGLRARRRRRRRRDRRPGGRRARRRHRAAGRGRVSRRGREPARRAGVEDVLRHAGRRRARRSSASASGCSCSPTSGSRTASGQGSGSCPARASGCPAA